jgi:hypothetical protein
LYDCEEEMKGAMQVNETERKIKINKIYTDGSYPWQ